MKETLGNLFDRIQSGTKDLTIYGAIAVVGICAIARIAEGVAVEDFGDFMGSGVVSKSVHMNTGDNLMIRDPNGIDFTVEYGSHWHMGFINYVEVSPTDPNLVANVVGYAQNPWSDTEGWEGFMTGRYSTVIENGNRPDDIWTVHDQNGDGIGTIDNGAWHLGSDDLFYSSNDLLLGTEQNRGDVSQLPVYDATFGAILDNLPQMIVSPVTAQSPVPEDGTQDVDLNVELRWAGQYQAVHNVYFGSDPDNLPNVSFEQSESVLDVVGLEWAKTYYWRVDEVDSEDVVYPGRIWSFDTIDDCSSSIVGDLTGDCIVDLQDFALMAENWLNCTRLGTGACP